jgi:hypothetical protein
MKSGLTDNQHVGTGNSNKNSMERKYYQNRLLTSRFRLINAVIEVRVAIFVTSIGSNVKNAAVLHHNRPTFGYVMIRLN